jgi:eukaryotic-like serine/threonine-protein kinase
MSSVYKARHPRSRDVVAVKLAARVVMNDAQLSRRFELEYAVAHPLHHPNLVRVLDFGKHDKVPYLVMEFVDGPSLWQYLQTHQRLTEHDALAFFLPIADAVTYLHKKQIVHRDIKPANILIGSDGMAKLADLGLLKDLESMSQLTRSNTGLGTMQFAAPEQFDDARSADVRSDIYSLAATLYLMVTGELPFGDGAVLSVLERKMQNQFTAPITKQPELRPSIDTAIRLGLNNERQRRPASVSEFTAILTGEKNIRSTLELPGTTLGPKPKPTRKPADERRSATRHSVALGASCRPIAGPANQRWAGTVVDVSTTGLCLRVKRRFEAGSVLEIAFTLKPNDSSLSQLARVRWLKDSESNSWLLGCEFVNALGDDELSSLG